MRKTLPYCLLTALMAGCHLGPSYSPPETSTPEEWKAPSIHETKGATLLEHWWDLFHDETLSSLEKTAVEKNPTLQSALERVAEARAQAGIAKADLYPEVNLNPSYTRALELIQLYGFPSNLFNIVPNLKDFVRVQEVEYALPVTMSYELDLWQKYRGTYNSAVLKAQAEEEAFRVTLLTLTTELASYYFNLQALDAQLELIREEVRYKREHYEISQKQYRSGLISQIDLLKVEQEQADLESSEKDLLRQRTLFENGIGTLLGKAPSEFHLAATPLANDPPTVPAGLPSTLLILRPDIAEAERKMAAEHALIGVAYASYFPSFSLTGAAGSLSPDWSSFLTWNSRLLQYGVKIVESVFNGWRNRSKVDAAWARFRKAQADYQQTVLQAFEEVENALNDIEQRGKQQGWLQEALAASSHSRHLFERRYETGLSNLPDLLSSKEREIEAKRKFLETLSWRYQSSIQLVKALGGTWTSEPSNS